MNRLQKAKDIAVTTVLSKMGYNPVKEDSHRAWYKSPFRSENQASMTVNKAKNNWKDWGDGKHGDAIDLVRMVESCSIVEAINYLLDGARSFNVHIPPAEPEPPRGIDIIDVHGFTSTRLIQYAASRAVSEEMLRRFCSEVEFSFAKNPGIVNTAIGFKNDKGGWELRNQKLKIGNSPKYWSTIRVSEETDRCLVFEGFFDFLSFMTRNPYDPYDKFVMNSLVYSSFLKPELELYDAVEMYLDNDDAGKRYIEEYFTDEKFEWYSPIVFPGFEDYNDYAIFKNERLNEQSN